MLTGARVRVCHLQVFRARRHLDELSSRSVPFCIIESVKCRPDMPAVSVLGEVLQPQVRGCRCVCCPRSRCARIAARRLALRSRLIPRLTA